MSTASGPRKKLHRFSDLSTEHQDEVVGQLGREAAETTLWEFVPRFPTEAAAALAWDVSVMVHDSRVGSVVRALKAGGKVRPILIDEMDERGAWMEGIHRSLAAAEVGMKTVPAFLRVE